MYSHLSNKRDVTLTDFGKFHLAQNKNPPCTFIDSNAGHKNILGPKAQGWFCVQVGL